MANILILSKSDLHSDPRLLKQIESLVKDYNITTCGYTKSQVAGVKADLEIFNRANITSFSEKLKLVFLLILRRFKTIYWSDNLTQAFNILKETKWDLIIANELETLPLAHKLSQFNNTPIYCDLHEYYFVDKGRWWYHMIAKKYKEWIADNYFPKVNHFSSINPGVIKLYKEEFNIDCELIDNACGFYDFKPKPTIPGSIKLITHGASIRPRRLELMIDVVALLDDRFSLDMYMMPSDKVYVEELKQKASLLPPNKVNIYPGIPFRDIQKTVNQYDIGLYIIFPSHLNNKLSLPNKLFEFIQGRVAIAIGPSESMITVMDEYDIGVVANTFEPSDLAEKINALNSDDIDVYKNNTMRAARERNSEQNENKIRRIAHQLIRDQET